jgi:hypothetical protein
VVVVDVVHGLEPGSVDDAGDLATYVTVRGTDFDDTDDATIEDEYDSTSTDPSGLERDDGWAGASVSSTSEDVLRQIDERIVEPIDATPDANPPADFTAAVLSHGRDPSDQYPLDDTDETPNTAALRAVQRARANTRFIVGGITVALIAVLLVILTSVFGGDSKSQTPTTDSVPITDPVADTGDTTAEAISDTIGAQDTDPFADPLPSS